MRTSIPLTLLEPLISLGALLLFVAYLNRRKPMNL